MFFDEERSTLLTAFNHRVGSNTYNFRTVRFGVSLRFLSTQLDFKNIKKKSKNSLLLP